MNKNPLILLFSIFISALSFAQDTTGLHDYLCRHRYALNLTSGHAFEMLPDMMKEKRLLVLGEGDSHGFEFYVPLKTAILEQLAHQNLKYYFIEFGRANAFFMNGYLKNEMTDCIQFYERYCRILDHEKNTIREHEFKIIGIDFERPMVLNADIRFLFQNENLDNRPHSRMLLTKLMDSSYKDLRGKYKPSVRAFQHFYKRTRREFYRDSAAIRIELGDKYAALEYLLSNPNTKYPWIDRNPAMARNLVREITPFDTSAVYFLSVGMAHSLPCEHYSTVHKLCKNEVLKNKILVMNTYCEHCIVDGQKVTKRSAMKFMNHQDVNACFSDAANADFVLFDLSQLPEEYISIKKYGDLLLFVRDQH
jgi:hypothetical protein